MIIKKNIHKLFTMHNITYSKLYETIGKNVAKYRKEKGLLQL